jgi:hypothetical protein
MSSGQYQKTTQHTEAGCFGRSFIQPKFSINNPSDEHEKEADHKALKVMQMKKSLIQAKSLPTTYVQRKCAHCEEEETKMQRKEKNGEETSTDRTLESYIGNLQTSGQSLATEVRNFYEPRFGYDLRNVKIHTDSKAAKSAQAINALAYTSGNNIVFNSGQYSPMTDNGKKLLGHELTHVIQQQGNRTNKIQRTNITGGQYGTELDIFSTHVTSVPNLVFRLLKRSPTFVKMAAGMDAHYVSHSSKRTPTNWFSEWGVNDKGVITKGPFIGRRMLAIVLGFAGSSFSPTGSPENDYGYDFIRLKPPDSSNQDQIVGEWIEAIAHETTHAFNMVTNRRPAATTEAARITAAIKDEVNTRATEARVATEATRGRLKGFTPTKSSQNPAQVQRDMFPSELKRTYLEQFVLSELISKAIAKESLSSGNIQTHNELVDRLPLNVEGAMQHPWLILYLDKKAGIYKSFQSKYDELRYIQRIIDSRWEDFGKNSLADPDIKEKILQEHAHAFFEGIFSYAPKP